LGGQEAGENRNCGKKKQKQKQKVGGRKGKVVRHRKRGPIYGQEKRKKKNQTWGGIKLVWGPSKGPEQNEDAHKQLTTNEKKSGPGIKPRESGIETHPSRLPNNGEKTGKNSNTKKNNPKKNKKDTRRGKGRAAEDKTKPQRKNVSAWGT